MRHPLRAWCCVVAFLDLGARAHDDALGLLQGAPRVAALERGRSLTIEAVEAQFDELRRAGGKDEQGRDLTVGTLYHMLTGWGVDIDNPEEKYRNIFGLTISDFKAMTFMAGEYNAWLEDKLDTKRQQLRSYLQESDKLQDAYSADLPTDSRTAFLQRLVDLFRRLTSNTVQYEDKVKETIDECQEVFDAVRARAPSLPATLLEDAKRQVNLKDLKRLPGWIENSTSMLEDLLARNVSSAECKSSLEGMIADGREIQRAKLIRDDRDRLTRNSRIFFTFLPALETFIAPFAGQQWRQDVSLFLHTIHDFGSYYYSTMADDGEQILSFIEQEVLRGSALP